MYKKRGLRIFGPDVLGAMLEGSKTFAKEFMGRHGIPTAKYVVATSVRQGLSAAKMLSYPAVIKEDGLAGGKGVTICQNKAEAKKIFDSLISEANRQLQQSATSEVGIIFGRGESSNERLSRLYTMRGLGYKGLGELAKAKNDLNKALEISPSNLWATAENL